MLGRTEPLDVIAPVQTQRFITATLENSDSSPGYTLNFIDSEAPDFCWQDQNFEVTNVALEDGRLLRSHDYTRIPRVARRLIVAGDNDDPTLLTSACKGSHVLIHEATYTQDVADRVGP